MIPSSALFQESMRFSRTMFTEMDIVYGGVVLENDVPITTGSLSTDRTRNTRYEASIDIGMYPWDSLPVNSKGTRIRLRRGVSSLGLREALQVGEYQVSGYRRTNRGSVGVTLKGLENFVIEADFIRPRTPPFGASTLATIATLIREVLPDAEIVVLCSEDRRITATGAWEKARWDAITALAVSVNAEVYAGYDGRWYIVDAPDLTQLVGRYRIAGGATGVLIEETRSDTRDGVYNAASVSAQSSDQTVPPVWAWARDTNPASPTYFYGPYGQKIQFYSSQFFTSAAQCQAYANRLLAQSLAPVQSLSIGASPIPFLEAGDPVVVVSEQVEETADYLLQKTALPLGNDAWSAEIQPASVAGSTNA